MAKKIIQSSVWWGKEGRRRERRRRRQVDSKTWPIFPSTLSVRIQQLMVRINTGTIVFFSSSAAPSSLLHCRRPPILCVALIYLHSQCVERSVIGAKVFLLRLLFYLPSATVAFFKRRRALHNIPSSSSTSISSHLQKCGSRPTNSRLLFSVSFALKAEEDGAEEAKTGEDGFSHCVNHWLYFSGVLY